MGKAGLQRLSNIRVRRLIEHIQFYLRAFDDTTGLQGSLGYIVDKLPVGQAVTRV